MIRTYNKQTVVVEQGVAKYLADIFCNSADTKPTDGLVNGSKLTEVDTGKTYLFDEANTEWVEYSEGGGGGGSTGGDASARYIVNENIWETVGLTQYNDNLAIVIEPIYGETGFSHDICHLIRSKTPVTIESDGTNYGYFSAEATTADPTPLPAGTYETVSLTGSSSDPLPYQSDTFIIKADGRMIFPLGAN